jgi:hypothetical protein
MTRLKVMMRWLGPLLGILGGYFANSLGMASDASVALGITILTALWWMFEAIPIPIASWPLLLFFRFLEFLTPRRQLLRVMGTH